MATSTAAQPVGAHQSETRLDGGRQLIAGFAAGASGVVVGHPMDTAKVWLQHGRAVSLRSFADVTALYAGTLVPLLTVGTVSAGVFFVNSRLLLLQTGDQASSRPTAKQRFWAGLGAGLAISPGTCVSVRLKTLLQTVERRRSLPELAAALYAAEGPRGLFRGWRAHVVVEACGRAVYFGSYDAVKAVCTRASLATAAATPTPTTTSATAGTTTVAAAMAAAGEAAPAPLGVRIFAGGLAGGLGWLVVYPFDVVKARMMSQPPGAPTFASELECARRQPQP